MQDKTNNLDDCSTPTGLGIHGGKTKTFRCCTTNETPIMFRGQPLEDVASFVYLGSLIDKLGGTNMDITKRIQKARAMFLILRNVWQSRRISRQTKLRIFRSNIKSVLLYGSETWRTTKAAMRKLQVFINNCIRRILRIKWSDRVPNRDLWEMSKQDPVEVEIVRRRWKWIGHTLRKPPTSITRQALSWNPQGKRGRGRPRNSWRRDLESDLKSTGYSWAEIATLAKEMNI